MNTAIKEIVEAIYTLKIKDIDKGFIRLLDALSPVVEAHPEYDWNPFLLSMQQAYMEKNYVALADMLLYDLKPVAEGLSL